MQFKNFRLILILSGLILATLLIVPIMAQAPEGEAYIVQANDWLSKIAEKEYGDFSLYPTIVEATNAKSQEDDSFDLITDPDRIEIGQKLWLPATVEMSTKAESEMSEQTEAEMASDLTAEMVRGIYKTMLPGASSPGLEVTLYLNADQSARVVNDYLNGEAPIVEVGGWQIVDGQVVLNLTGQVERTYDEPVVSRLAYKDGILREVRSEPLPGAYVTTYLPFRELATGNLALPYDPETAQTAFTEAGPQGIYKGFAPAATCCGQDITLILSPNNNVIFEIDYLNGEAPIVRTGTWEAVGDNRIDLLLENADSPLMLEMVNGVLKTTADEDQYGQVGLSLYEYGPIALHSNLPAVSGTVTYRERIAMPPQAVVTVQLLDVSRQDVPATVLGEDVIDNPGQVPVSFEISYNPREFDSTHTYAVRAEIRVDGELRFTTTTQYQVLTGDAPSNMVEIVLESVS